MNESEYSTAPAKEREAFSERLRSALRSAGYSHSPTEVCRHFNIRYNGVAVTIHAVRKWLVGESIPTQDKIRTLCEWLSVSMEWLRFGQDVGLKPIQSKESTLDKDDVKILTDLKAMSSRDKTVLKGIIRSMISTPE